MTARRRCQTPLCPGHPNHRCLSPPRRVLILGAAPSQLLDIAGPAEILAQAGQLNQRDAGSETTALDPHLYDVSCLIVPEPGTLATSAGLALQSSIAEARGAWLD